MPSTSRTPRCSCGRRASSWAGTRCATMPSGSFWKAAPRSPKPCGSATSSRTGWSVPSFSYRGRDSGGEVVQGVADGATAGAVAEQLFGKGITPLDIEPAGKEAAESAPGSGLFQTKGQHLDVLLFSRQLHT